MGETGEAQREWRAFLSSGMFTVSESGSIKVSQMLRTVSHISVYVPERSGILLWFGPLAKFLSKVNVNEPQQQFFFSLPVLN